MLEGHFDEFWLGARRLMASGLVRRNVSCMNTIVPIIFIVEEQWNNPHNSITSCPTSLWGT